MFHVSQAHEELRAFVDANYSVSVRNDALQHRVVHQLVRAHLGEYLRSARW